jgi:hypothetical protein
MTMADDLYNRILAKIDAAAGLHHSSVSKIVKGWC